MRKARAEVAAYAECTESQMMAMFGWTNPKMPAHYIAQANREKLGISGMDKTVTFDLGQSLDDFLRPAAENRTGTATGNEVVSFPGNIRKKL
ncbi:putative phage integrase/recombinase [Bradyrhizobium oligotrophicum S58]|uniref:Putative phage integrase/recombinase n=1 Tax=Bradyrhizobium oligotrophicum S58 TaxID=1245469 RepID=M4Z6V8_9BRAD|nr:phage integrase/recombinase [Bradyrhizobium oligotrophicum]BAM89134.1 putative phage integrase/recombinase [Bradyrhizobium oligotrophicum S58]